MSTLRDAVPTDAGARLVAGGLLDEAHDAPPSEAVEAVRWHHEALGDTPIVRLRPKDLALADASAMALAGFVDPDVLGVVGHRKRTPPGFPDWILIHRPDLARWAMDKLDGFLRASALAGSKPGRAQSGFNAIARSLQNKVPEALESYHEAVARVFSSVGNDEVTARYVGRALSAAVARADTLDLDDLVRRAHAWVDASALSREGMEALATLLATPAPGRAHFTEYLQLATERTRTGEAPWEGLIAGVRKVAHAEGIAPEDADDALMRALLPLPATRSAPAGFWKRAVPCLIRLAQADPEIASRLLQTLPAPDRHLTLGAGEVDALTTWLTMLDDLGLIERMAAMPPDPRSPHGAPAQWVRMLLTTGDVHRLPPGVLTALLTRLGDRLRHDRVPIDTSRVAWARLPLVVIDTLVAEALPVGSYDAHQPLGLRHGHLPSRDGLRGVADSPSPAPLAALLLHPVLGPALTRDRTELGAAAVAQAREHAPLLGVLTRLARIHLDTMGHGALADVEDGVAILSHWIPSETLRDLPEARACLDALDLGTSLARTLQIGVPDELGIPAVDAARAMWPHATVRHAWFPWTVVHTHDEAIVVRGARDHARIALDLPKDAQHVLDAIPSADDLWVRWRDVGWRSHGMWCGDPAGTTKATDARTPAGIPLGIVQPDGRYQLPIGCLTPGSPPKDDIGSAGQILCDDDGLWSAPSHGAGTPSPVGPPAVRTAPGPWPLPACAKGDRVLWDHTHAIDLPPDTESPVEGVVDGRWRHAVVQSLGHGTTTWSTRIGDRDVISGPWSIEVRWPGGGVRRVDGAQRHLWDAGTGIRGGTWTTQDAYGRDTPATDTALPPLYWHFASPRDPEGSKALRAVAPAQAATWIAACRQGKSPIDVVTEGLTEVTHPVLRAAVAVELQRAVAIAESLDPLRDLVSPSGSTGRPAVDLDEAHTRAIAAVARACGVSMYAAHATVAAPPSPGDTEGFPLPSDPDAVRWALAFGGPHGLLWHAASPLAPPTARRAFVTAAQWLLDHVFDGEDPAAWWVRVPLARGQAAPPHHTVRRRGPFHEIVYPQPHAPDGFLDGTSDGWYLALVIGPRAEAEAAGSVREVAFDGVVDRAIAQAWIARLSDRPPPTFEPEMFSELGQATGLTETQAGAVWLGLYELFVTMWLDETPATQLGMTRTPYKTARETMLRQLRGATRHAFFADAARCDVACLDRLVGGGSDDPTSWVHHVARCWIDRFGARPALDDATIKHAKKVLGPTAVSHLSRLIDGEDAPIEDPWTLGTAAVWSLQELPSGHPLQVRGLRALERLDTTFATPGLWVDVFDIHTHAALGRHLDAATISGLVDTLNRRSDPDAGFLSRTLDEQGPTPVLRVERQSDWVTSLAVQTSEIRQPEDWSTLLASFEGTYDTSRASSRDWRRWLPWLRTGPLAQLRATMAGTGLPDGAYEVDPRVSVPDLVATVASTLGVPDDSATLYLQLLALPFPTVARIGAFNGWTRPIAEAAAKPLHSGGWIVRDERSRAGRPWFLPGGWITARSPLPPVETWVVQAHGGTIVSDKTYHPRLGVPLMWQGPSETYHAAWRAWTTGPKPGETTDP